MTTLEDDLVRVDRSICPVYPDWVMGAVSSKNEQSGPDQFDPSALKEEYLFNMQGSGKSARGYVVHRYLVRQDLIDSCLNLQDLLAIQERGSGFFRKHFFRKAVIAWKSVVRDRGGAYRVPFLIDGFGMTRIDWDPLREICYSSRYPVFTFAS